MAPGHERIDAIVPLVASRHARAAIHAAWRAAWATRSEPCRTLLRNSIFYHCRPPCRAGVVPVCVGLGRYARMLGAVWWCGKASTPRGGAVRFWDPYTALSPHLLYAYAIMLSPQSRPGDMTYSVRSPPNSYHREPAPDQRRRARLMTLPTGLFSSRPNAPQPTPKEPLNP